MALVYSSCVRQPANSCVMDTKKVAKLVCVVCVCVHMRNRVHTQDRHVCSLSVAFAQVWGSAVSSSLGVPGE